MRQRLLPLIALLLLVINLPVQAEPACGSDTSTDPDVARGKDVWLNGYCQGFLPCRLVLEQFHACQAAEGFLSRLDAKEGVPLTESQVEDALLRTTGSATGMSACLWSFDAEGCKRYLGLGGGGQDADSPVAAAGAAAVDAPAARKPMSNTAAVVARQRIRDMDANAHTGVGVIERACKAGAEECRATLEQLVDPVVREAEELNANPEYLAQLPVYTPGSLEYAGRLGWTKQDGRWVFGGGGPAASTGTLGSYLLTVEECKKLHERLAQAVRSEPGKEPTELSFFEAECLPQLPALAADIGQWRQGFGAAGPAVTEVAAIEAVAAVPDVEPAALQELGQWHDDLSAEESRRVAEAEALERAEAERQAEQVAALEREQLAAAEQLRQSMPANSRYSSVCARNEAKLQKVISESGYRDYSGFAMENEEKIRLSAALHAPCVGDERSISPGSNKSSRAIVEGMERELQIHRQNCARWSADCSQYYYDQHSGNEADSTRNFMALFRSEVQQSLSDPYYSADLEPGGGNAPANRRGAGTNAGAGQASGDASCEAKFKAIDGQVAAALPGCGESAVCNLQAAMWGLSQQISSIESYCPSGRFAAQLSKSRKELESVTTTCNQIASGGRCSPKL